MIATECGAVTAAGAVRENNEDSLLAEFPVFVVADGMGGHAGGEVASECASEAFRDLAGRLGITIKDILGAIDRANETIIATAGADASLAGMGTTLVGLALVVDQGEERWIAFNVGDSRLYRLSDGVLQQVSTDHSEVQEMVDEGSITAEQARVHPLRNVVTRVLGVDLRMEPDYWLLTPVDGERFLLCSDGLNGEVGDDAIRDTLVRQARPAAAANRLVEQAMASGGHDNISVVVVDVQATETTEIDDTTETDAGTASS
jgi:serine/threonine protein phosphatase PrpC